MSPYHFVRLGVFAVLVIVGAVGWATRQSSAVPGSRSTDGVFATGECVALTSTSVGTAPCLGQHNAKVVAVIHGAGQTCPGGTDLFRVNDGTGDLCLDITDHAP